MATQMTCTGSVEEAYCCAHPSQGADNIYQDDIPQLSASYCNSFILQARKASTGQFWAFAARLGEAVGHYAALVIAENPVEEHRQFLLRQATVDEGKDSTAPPPGAWDTEAQRQGAVPAPRGRPSMLGVKRASALGKGPSEPAAPNSARVRLRLQPLYGREYLARRCTSGGRVALATIRDKF